MDFKRAKLLLEILAILHIIVGIILPFTVDSWLFTYYNRQMLAAFNTDSAEALELGKFMLGILGPTIASWGVIFLFLVRHAYGTRSKSAWYYMLAAIIGWSAYDMALSILAGVYLNVLIDLVVLILLLTPLILSRSHFLNKSI